MNRTTIFISPAALRARLGFVPSWLATVLAEAEKAGKNVCYTYCVGPAGRYPVSATVTA